MIMKFLKTLLLASCGANRGAAFAPPGLVTRRGLVRTYLSAAAVAGKKAIKHCIPLQDIGLDDLPKVGGKTASLGEMIQQLTPLGVSVPGGELRTQPTSLSYSEAKSILHAYSLRIWRVEHCL